jgi:heptosyltransferase III
MPEKQGKILVIRGGAIGDFILTLPAIAALRETFPQTHLELLGYTKVAELARSARLIDGFRSIEASPLARFFARNAKLDEEWSAYFESFNLIFSYLYDPDEIFKTNIGRASTAQFIQGIHRPNETDDLHATAVFLKPLERFAIFDADPVPKLSFQKSLSGDWLAAHPGSGSEKKNWPLERWNALLQGVLAESKANLLLISGEAEGERIAQMARAWPSHRVRLAHNLSLVELASLLASGKAFLGHDSGVTHIAAALGIPSIVLWGPSRESIWRPLGPHIEILKNSAGLENLEVATVLGAVLRRLQS